MSDFGISVSFTRSLLAVGAASASLLVFGVAAARSELAFHTVFGGSGSGAGQFAGPRGIGVDQTTLDPTSGDVYVADTGNARVEQFDSSGQFIGAWGWGVADGASSYEVCTSACRAGIAGHGAGQFSDPTSVAVDSSSGPSQGDVYVADSTNNVVDELSPSGSLLATITGPSPSTLFRAVKGVAVDPSGDLWVLDRNTADELGSGGALLSQFNDHYENMEEIAVDAIGDVYLIVESGQTQKWTPAARAGLSSAEAVDSAAGSGLAVDPSRNDLYIDLGGAVDQWGAAGEPLGSFGSGSLNYGAQLAYNPNVTLPAAGGQGALYVADQSANDVAVFVTPPPAAPTVLPQTQSAVKVISTGATLNATIDANGLDTKYFFEYGPTTAYGTEIPISPGTDIGSNHAPATASVELSGLTVSTTYHFRVVATNSLGTTEGPDATFATLPPALIDSAFATHVTATAADLGGKIDPEGLDTHYRFEYGATPSYGTDAPVPEGDIGAAEGDVGATVHLQNLQPSTRYYYRLVATNALGTVTASPQTFTTYPAGEPFALPDNRVYELVSPPNKNGGEVGGGGSLGVLVSGLGKSSASGSAITYTSYTSFSDAQSAEFTTQYLSSRESSGWTTHAISPPSLPVEGSLRFKFAPYYVFTPELTAGVLDWVNPALTAGAPQKFDNLYVQATSSSTYQLVTTVAPPNQTPASYKVNFAGASTDLSRVAFDANDALTPGAPANSQSVYEWTEGSVRLASVLPGPGDVAAESAGAGDGKPEDAIPNEISADGSRVFWTDGNLQLYVREGGARTVKLNASQRTPSLGDGSAVLRAATPDGSKVFFTDETPLTDGPGDSGGLYEYDFNSGRLTDLTRDAGGSPGVEGLVGTSEDGTSVYFVASAPLAAGAAAGVPNLYLARAGAIRLIAALSSEDSSDWTQRFEVRTARVVPDGGHLAFMSRAPLTGYDNIDAATGKADTEVFVYDAGAGRLSCASCNPSGGQPIGSSSVPVAAANVEGGLHYTPRYISNDGQRVFFDSEDSLVPSDTNGTQDVYEYENGAVHPISSGTSSDASALADIDPNGDNVFFTTRSMLVAEDQDENTDMYDARVGGGFPVSATPAPCSAEGCRGPLSTPPAPVAVATEAYGPVSEGSGSTTQSSSPPRSPAHARKSKTRKPHRKSAKRRSARRAKAGRHRRRRVGGSTGRSSGRGGRGR